jgi:hypothetical protein
MIYFSVKIKYNKTGEDGKTKAVSESYLIDAETFTHAETIMNREARQFVDGEFEVTHISKTKIVSVDVDTCENKLYEVTFKIEDLQDDGKVKAIKEKQIFEAESVGKVEEMARNYCESVAFDCEVMHIKETLFVAVF